MTKHTAPTALTTANMAMQFYTPSTGTERTLALPPGLTADEAVRYAKQWQGTAEIMTGIVTFRSR